MEYKRVLTIQDLSCLGQCSGSVALTTLSAFGYEACLLPTALLSTHTGGFGRPAVVHFEDALPEIWRHWQENGISFDAILVGYLGSAGAIAAAADILDRLLAPGGIAIVDPAMGDNGRLYSGFDGDYVRAMKGLCRKADIVLPNVTEAALLSGMEYRERLSEDYVTGLLDALNQPCVVLTGVGFSEGETGVLLRDGRLQEHYAHPRIGGNFSGTGDIFAACFTGALMRDKTKLEAVRIAGDFTRKCIENTAKNPAHWYGIKFETVLPDLMRTLSENASGSGRVF